MDRYKGMIIWILGTSMQWPECLEILDMIHLLAYFIIPKGVTILMVKLDDLLNITGNIDSKLLLDTVLLSMSRKYI